MQTVISQLIIIFACAVIFVDIPAIILKWFIQKLNKSSGDKAINQGSADQKIQND